MMATILIVGERTLDRELAASLERHGHRVIEAADGEDALETIRAERPDVVLSEILSPSPGGLQLVQRLHPQLGGSAPPQVVFLTPVYLEAEARALAQACGVSRLLVTPAESGALLAAVNDALSAPRSPAPDSRPDSSAIGTHLRQIAGKLNQRAAELERATAQLNEHVAGLAGQLETARAALAQEVTKRLWAEQELTQANLRLREKALRDPLTGLYNRGYLEESLNREASRARRSDRPFGVMMIDIDHFKRCNDTFGHAAGDTVLRAVGRYLLSLARAEDIPCRYGGEEFVLLMSHASPATVRERAETLRLGVQELGIECDGRSVGPITLSVGIAMFPDHGDSGQAVLEVADSALYRAKQAGRNCVVVNGERGEALNMTGVSAGH